MPSFFDNVRRRLASSPAVLFAVLICLTACNKHHQSPPPRAGLPSVAVEVQAVETRNHRSSEDVVGTIRAQVRATLEAKVSGRIAELPVVLGQKVKAGQLIARLDAAEITARLEQAQAALQEAERNWKRVSSLFKQQAATRSEQESAEARHRTALAGVAEAKAMLDYVEVHAPFDGVVTRKSADAGDLAAPGKPLVTIEDPSKLQLEADVPEAIAARVTPAARMQITVDSLGTEFTGQVSEMAPTADPDSRTFRVKLDLPPTPGLMPGQFARLQVPLGEASSLRVPASAVVQRGQLELVFVAADNRAQLHLVKTGRPFGKEVEVLSGLDSGDSVITQGAPLLRDGQPITLK